MISKKRVVFIFKITQREFISGQFFWLAFSVQILTTLFLALISDAALDEAQRIYDSLSYFLTSLSGLSAAVFVGAYTWTKDFSKNGIGELLCHFKTKPFDLYMARFFSWAVFIALYNVFSYFAYGICVFSFAQERFSLQVIVTMFIFSSAHSILALSLAQSLGTFLRPAIAFIGSALLLAVGNISDTLTGVTQLTAAEHARLPLISRWAMDFLQIWKPEILVLAQLQGTWQVPQAQEILKAVAWAATMVSAFCCIAFFVTQKKQILER